MDQQLQAEAAVWGKAKTKSIELRESASSSVWVEAAWDESLGL